MPNSAVESILQAMIANATAAHAKATLDQQKVRDTEEARRNQSDEKLRGDALKQAMDIANQNHEHQIAQEDIQHEANKLHAKSLHLSSVQQMREDVSKGLIKPEATQQSYDFPDLGISIPQGSIMADGEAIPSSQFETPEGRLKQIEQEGLAKEVGPAKLREQQDAANYQRTIDAQEAMGKRANELENLRFGHEQVLHGMDNAARIKIAGMAGLDPGSNVISDIYINGTGDKYPGKVRTGAAGSVPNGWTPLVKGDNDVINGIPQIDSLLKAARDLTNYSWDTDPVGAGKRWLGVGEAGSAKGLVEGQLGQISRVFGGERGVLTNQDINRARELFSNPKLTQKQMLNQLNEIEGQWKAKINTYISKFPPEQREAILTKKGIDPTKYSGGSSGGVKQLDESTARDFLTKAGGDKDKARAAAKAAGYEVK